MGVVFVDHAHPTPSVRPLICRQVGKTDTSLCGSGYEQATCVRAADRRHAAPLMLGALRGS